MCAKKNHYEAILPPGLLQPLAIPDGAWVEISMDFVEGLPVDHGKSVLWVVIDRFTKYGHCQADRIALHQGNFQAAWTSERYSH